jgi:uncharacterized glyoxalase superfamily protein PhnB
MMTTEKGRPAHMPRVSPYLTVKDSDAAIAFYEKAFGFMKRNAAPMPDGRTGHVEMTFEEAVIMFGPEYAYGGLCQAPATSGTQSPVNLYVYCPDVDALYARAVAAGARTGRAPEDSFWGDRMCQLTDPDGHSWCFATFKGQAAAA